MMMPSPREAMRAAEFFVNDFERALDDRLGRPVRRVIGRYVGLVIVAVPIAWIVPGLRWTSASTGGLIAGVALYAFIDFARMMGKRSRSTADRHR